MGLIELLVLLPALLINPVKLFDPQPPLSQHSEEHCNNWDAELKPQPLYGLLIAQDVFLECAHRSLQSKNTQYKGQKSLKRKQKIEGVLALPSKSCKFFIKYNNIFIHYVLFILWFCIFLPCAELYIIVKTKTAFSLSTTVLHGSWKSSQRSSLVSLQKLIRASKSRLRLLFEDLLGFLGRKQPVLRASAPPQRHWMQLFKAPL